MLYPSESFPFFLRILPHMIQGDVVFLRCGFGWVSCCDGWQGEALKWASGIGPFQEANLILGKDVHGHSLVECPLG